MIYSSVLRWYTTYQQTPSVIHHTGGQTQIGPSLCSWSLLFICLSLCTLSNQHAGCEGSRSPPLWSPRGTTGAPPSPSGAQPPVSLAQSGNILCDVELHHQEAEQLAGFHGAFVDSRAARSQPAHLTASTPRAVPHCYIYGTYSLPQQEKHGCYADQHFGNTAWK